MSDLVKPLEYRIGGGIFITHFDVITEVPYDMDVKPPGLSIAYCNLFDENKTGAYAPYLAPTATAAQYGELVPDPRGPGFTHNITEQFQRRRTAGFDRVELDNGDAFSVVDLVGVCELAGISFDLDIVAKNPLSMSTYPTDYIKHHRVVGIIVERDDDLFAVDVDELRKRAGKPALPIWFISFNEPGAHAWAQRIAAEISRLAIGNAFVSYDGSANEYGGDMIEQLVTGATTLPATTSPPVQPSGDRTPWLTYMAGDLGLEEYSGAADNPKIIAKAMAIANAFPNVPGFRSYCSLYKHDDIAWCGLEVGSGFAVGAGIMPPFNAAVDTESFLWARAWAGWGIALPGPIVGCVVVFSGHVAVCSKVISSTTFEVIGGNQSTPAHPEGGGVTRSQRHVSEVVAFRWPPGVPVVAGETPGDTDRPLIKIGAVGPAVTRAQQALISAGYDVGPDGADGGFGVNTDLAVRRFQADHRLDPVDGEIGDDTWAALLASHGGSTGRREPIGVGQGGLTADTVAAILATAARSSLAGLNWPGRGHAPIGYIKGMALMFGELYERLLDGGDDVTAVATQDIGSPSRDVLAWYSIRPSGKVDTLVKLVALLIGLGMRESSGKYNEGRDASASNTSGDTAEAGLFQQSWDSRPATPVLPRLFAWYRSASSPPGFQEIFREGVPAKSFRPSGSGDGAVFQQLCVDKPAFAMECALVGARTIRSHWGPFNEHAAAMTIEAQQLLQQVATIVDAGHAVKPPPPPPPPVVEPPPPPPPPVQPNAIEATLAEIRAVLEKHMAPLLLPPIGSGNPTDLLNRISQLEALLRGQAPPEPAPKASDAPPSTIDTVLGGKSLMGLKTIGGIIGLVGTFLGAKSQTLGGAGINWVDIAGSAFTLLAGGGLAAKIDRVISALLAVKQTVEKVQPFVAQLAPLIQQLQNKQQQ